MTASGISHSKHSAIADGGDTTLVRPVDWNDDMVVDHIQPTTSTELDLYSDNGWNNGQGGFQLIQDDSVYIFGGTGHGDMTATGVIMSIGPANLELRVVQQSASASPGTIQVYTGGGPDGYNVNFREQSENGRFEFTEGVDGGVAIPSLGMLPKYSAAPHSGVEIEGEMYYDTTLHKPRCWNGSSWNNLF
jgi:hypothetical protein